MALRVISPLAPMLRGSPSVRPCPARWQVAQAMVLFPDRRGSENRSLPRATFSAVGGLPGGIGTGPSTAAAPVPARAALSVFQATATTAMATARGMTTSHGQRGRTVNSLSEFAPFGNGAESIPMSEPSAVVLYEERAGVAFGSAPSR